MKLTDLCARLQTDPESISWSEKVAAVAKLTEGLGWRDKLPKQAAGALPLLAGDGKWEVRKAVADILHLVPDPHFEELAARLSQDNHHFVRGAAEKALERRSKSQAVPKRRGRGLTKAEREFSRMAKSYGEEMVTIIRDQAVRLYEGLVGASVHELTAILSALRGDMNSLATEVDRGNSVKAVTRYVPRLRDTLLFMEHLLEDMRTYTGSTQAAKHTEVLANLIKDAVGMVQADFMGRKICTEQIALTVEVPTHLVLPVARKQFILALRNLIKNAHEAILEDPERDGKGNVGIHAWRDGDHHEIRIADDGMGLDATELDQVLKFIPGNSSKSNGTGYGLPIAQRYITSHQGTLKIESTDGIGTTIIVRVPSEAIE